MGLMDRFPDCDGGDYTPPEWQWHMALTAALIEIDRLSELLSTAVAQIFDLQSALDRAGIERRRSYADYLKAMSADGDEE